MTTRMDWPALALGAVIGWAIGAACGAAGVILAIVQIYKTGARYAMRNSYLKPPPNYVPALVCGAVLMLLLVALAGWCGVLNADANIPGF